MRRLQRSAGPELLDGSGHDRAQLARSLRHVGAVDRWLGGARALRRHLTDVAAPAREPLRVLDVGTGDGSVLRRLARWLAARRGSDVVAVGAELHPEVLAVAVGERDGAGIVRLVRADVRALPFADDAFDVVVSTLTLHHFAADEAVRVLREMARVARGRVLVGDLERSRLHHLGARLLAATVWRRDPITRHDGPLSVLRSFTAPELEELGRQAGLRRLRVRRHVPFRLVLDAHP